MIIGMFKSYMKISVAFGILFQTRTTELSLNDLEQVTGPFIQCIYQWCVQQYVRAQEFDFYFKYVLEFFLRYQCELDLIFFVTFA